MKITLKRINNNNESTIGLLYINDIFQCFTIEDAFRKNKIIGKTRIPAGFYKMELRNEGGLTKKYASKYGTMHKGMLWLRRVENFKYVYIHVGNTAKDSEGCILVGDTLNNNSITNGFCGHSSNAYKRIYPKIANAIGKEYTYIDVIDENQ